MAELNRRFLLGAAGAGAAASVVGGGSADAQQRRGARAGATRPILMKLGTQEESSEENFARFQRYGVKNVGGSYKSADPRRLYPTVEELSALIALGRRYDISIDLIDSKVGRGNKSAVMMGPSDAREREIEAFQTTIKNCAAAGIPTIKYYLSILPILRSSRTPGRGDTEYNRWNYADAVANPERTIALAEETGLLGTPHLTEEVMWERITYFLDRVVPVANQYKIRLAQHPHDPGMPPGGFMGIPQVLGTVEGLKRFVSINESPYHGLNFCQGTVCEMLDDPKKEIFEVIRWFGERKKIFNVHFRNIRGHRGDLIAECFPDDGDIDMPATVRSYQAVGYDGMLMPDHVPVTLPRGRDARELHAIRDASFVFAYGYIRGLLQSAASV